MRYTGIITPEALLSDSVLNFAVSQRTDPAHPGRVLFELESDLALAVSEELSHTLKPASWASLRCEYETMLIFPNKIFKFPPTDVVTKQKALDYGTSLGISNQELTSI